MTQLHQPVAKKAHPIPRAARIVMILAFAAAGVFAIVIILRLLGLLRPFYLPTNAMAPAVPAGNHVFSEGLTFLVHPPRRGDILIFKTDGIHGLQQNIFYTKRLVGLPGEHLEFSNSDLYINGQLTVISNRAGPIDYSFGAFMAPLVIYTNVNIPPNDYFVVGDQAQNSSDSRTWGFLPGRNIKGKIFFCYWPPDQFGPVK
jgi:signal peptidase I